MDLGRDLACLCSSAFALGGRDLAEEAHDMEVVNME